MAFPFSLASTYHNGRLGIGLNDSNVVTELESTTAELLVRDKVLSVNGQALGQRKLADVLVSLPSSDSYTLRARSRSRSTTRMAPMYLTMRTICGGNTRRASSCDRIARAVHGPETLQPRQ